MLLKKFSPGISINTSGFNPVPVGNEFESASFVERPVTPSSSIRRATFCTEFWTLTLLRFWSCGREPSRLVQVCRRPHKSCELLETNARYSSQVCCWHREVVAVEGRSTPFRRPPQLVPDKLPSQFSPAMMPRSAPLIGQFCFVLHWGARTGPFYKRVHPFLQCIKRKLVLLARAPPPHPLLNSHFARKATTWLAFVKNIPIIDSKKMYQ